MSANDRQVAGDHYKADVQHWDLAAAHSYDYFQGQVTKYVDRWKKKNGLQDLKKAQHFLEKYIECVETGVIEDPTLKRSTVKGPKPIEHHYSDCNYPLQRCTCNGKENSPAFLASTI